MCFSSTNQQGKQKEQTKDEAINKAQMAQILKNTHILGIKNIKKSKSDKRVRWKKNNPK